MPILSGRSHTAGRSGLIHPHLQRVFGKVVKFESGHQNDRRCQGIKTDYIYLSIIEIIILQPYLHYIHIYIYIYIYIIYIYITYIYIYKSQNLIPSILDLAVKHVPKPRQDQAEEFLFLKACQGLEEVSHVECHLPKSQSFLFLEPCL